MSEAGAVTKAMISPPEREAMLAQLDQADFDVLVIGAGINGAVSAAAAAGSGARVAIVDRSDFAAGVSSHSSNLAWGGIKYLESGELGLVRKLCKSRNRLMDAYPSTVREIRFFTSIKRGFRMWPIFVWAGAVLYWLMGNCRMSPPRYLSRQRIAREEPSVATSDVIGGLEYSDCYLFDNDSRFVFNFIRQAMDNGAVASNYCEVKDLQWQESEGRWQVSLRDQVSSKELICTAGAVVNATGPAADALNKQTAVETEHRHVLSKGIHLIVDRVTEAKRVLTFFASDGRLFFVIPMGPKTCIGTTDTQVPTADVDVSTADRDFVLANANAMLALDRPLTPADVIAERVGVRPLAVAGAQGDRDWVQLSRKHELEIDKDRRFLTIFGGKLTDCLNVGDEIVATLADLGVRFTRYEARWYGEPSVADKARFLAAAANMSLDELTPERSPEPLSLRFWRRYGLASFDLLDAIRKDPKEAELVLQCADYTRAEIKLTARREMIVRMNDFLRRRSKVELVVREAMLSDDPGLSELSNLLGFG